MPADSPLFDVADYVRRPLGPMRAALTGVGTALPDDLAEALRYLQRRAQGYVVPESFTHGSSAQRVRWFRTGLESGDIQRCDTFGTDRL